MAQKEDDSLFFNSELSSVKITRPNSTYNFYLKRVRKLYPYALYAAEVLGELDEELTTLNKKRELKKTSKEKQKQLFDEFNFMVRDLYQSEGKLLMKLIHRETGMTVKEIVLKYRGKIQATVFNTMASLFEQDLNVKYDSKGQDRLIEKIILDINKESVYFDPTYKKVTKQDYKDGMKTYRAEKKEVRKSKKADKKSKR
ncbi:MAG TPA: DUF4294 domain-containing protein [Crocinitomicaceae bacterium]|nr:DUF4294 domain-containing protein [Crocinitomicaceae bacterium]